MSVERIAVVVAVMSAAVSAGSLLLAWHRGSARQRPKLARALGALTVASAGVLIVALAFASAGPDEPRRAARGTLTAGEYRLQLIGICKEHLASAQRIEQAESDEPVFGEVVLLETQTTGAIEALRPPSALATDHRRVLVLWGRRLSLLDHYYVEHEKKLGDPDFRREFVRALKRIDELTVQLHARFVALGVTPECNLFV